MARTLSAPAFDIAPGLASSSPRLRFRVPGPGHLGHVDRFEGVASDPLTLNKYAYAHADPVNNVDPSGLLSIGSLAVTGGVIGFSAGFVHGAILGAREGVGHAIVRGLVEGGAGLVIGAGAGALIGYGGIGLAYLAKGLGVFLPPSTAIYGLATAAGIGGAYQGYSEIRDSEDKFEVFAGLFTLFSSLAFTGAAARATYRSAPDAWIPWKPRVMYRGTTFYDAIETVQNGRIDFARIALRQGDGSAYDLGPGLYMTESLATAQTFASANAALAGGQSPKVIVIEVSNGRWWWLRWHHGAMERVPISNMEGHTQNFVPPQGVPHINRYGIFYLGD